MKHLERRLELLEARLPSSGIVVIRQRSGEDPEDVEARWERENGPIGDRHALVVLFVKAQQ